MLAYSRLGEHGALWHGLALVGAVADRTAAAALPTRNARNPAHLWSEHRDQAADPPRPPRPRRPPAPDAHDHRPLLSLRPRLDVLRGRPLALGALPGPPLYAAAAAMALSRPYLGVHYPSDIAAGALLGDALGLLTP